MSKFIDYAHRAEMLIERLRPKRGEGDLIVEPYLGYSTPNGVVVRGRVLEAPSLNFIDNFLSRTGTAGAMAKNFLTSEVAGVKVEAGGKSQLSDEEGYFTIEVDRSAISDGSVAITIPKSNDAFKVPVVVSRADASHGIISDIDDTVIETGAWELARNIWTTFTTSSEERVVFDDTVALINERRAGINPVFYVSSSPWNLHQYLLEVFKRGDVPMGPIFLRDLGIDENKFIKSSHGSHKGDAISTVLAANPDLTFTLVGDTGQHDGEVYLEAIESHPGRITAVFLRHAGPMDGRDKDIANKIAATGTDFFSGDNFKPFLSANTK